MFTHLFQFNDFLLLFIANEFFKTWNCVVDSNTHVCLCIQMVSWFRLIDKRVLNPASHKYVVANAMSTARPVFHNLGKY